MSTLEQKAVDLLDKLDALTSQYAPEVVDQAVNAVRITAIGEIIYGVITILVAILLSFVAIRLSSYFRKKREEEGKYSSWDAGVVMIMGGGIIVVSIMLIGGGLMILDIWNWVAIFNPELALAHSLLGL